MQTNENEISNATVTTQAPATKPTKAKRKLARKVAKKATKTKKPAKPEVRHESKASIASPVAAVHTYLHAHGKGMRRRDALAALDAKGIAYYTVRTQYQRWFADPKASKAKYGKGAKAA